jgi:hypothetical protein
MFLIFSTQPDVLRAWLRRTKPVPPSVAAAWIPSEAESSKVHAFDETYVNTGMSGSKSEADTVDLRGQLIALQGDSRHRLSWGESSTVSNSRATNGVPSSRFDRPGMV